MKTKTTLAALATLALFSGSVTLQAGDPASPAPAKKTAAPTRPPTEPAATETRRDPVRANSQPVTYITVRVASPRSRAPWAPGAPGD